MFYAIPCRDWFVKVINVSVQWIIIGIHRIQMIQKDTVVWVSLRMEWSIFVFQFHMHHILRNVIEHRNVWRIVRWSVWMEHVNVHRLVNGIGLVRFAVRKSCEWEKRMLSLYSIVQLWFNRSMDLVSPIENAMEHYNWFVITVNVFVQVPHLLELGFGMELTAVCINSLIDILFIWSLF